MGQQLALLKESLKFVFASTKWFNHVCALEPRHSQHHTQLCGLSQNSHSHRGAASALLPSAVLPLHKLPAADWAADPPLQTESGEAKGNNMGSLHRALVQPLEGLKARGTVEFPSV